MDVGLNDEVSSTVSGPKQSGIEVSVPEAVFLRSDSELVAMPPVDPAAPEVAFLGKSNVGKSSLLNALMLRKGLVKTSKTPGHTRLLNQFGVTLQLRRRSRHLTLVDLPGYGFAKMPKSQQVNLSKMLGAYLSNREGLRALVHLFDMRHEPTAQDIETWGHLSVLTPVRIVVGTKSDRVSKSKLRHHQKMIAKALGIHADDVVVFSAESREGRNVLWGRILQAVDAQDPNAAGDGDGDDGDGAEGSDGSNGAPNTSVAAAADASSNAADEGDRRP